MTSFDEFIIPCIKSKIQEPVESWAHNCSWEVYKLLESEQHHSEIKKILIDKISEKNVDSDIHLHVTFLLAQWAVQSNELGEISEWWKHCTWCKAGILDGLTSMYPIPQGSKAPFLTLQLSFECLESPHEYLLKPAYSNIRNLASNKDLKIEFENFDFERLRPGLASADIGVRCEAIYTIGRLIQGNFIKSEFLKELIENLLDTDLNIRLSASEVLWWTCKKKINIENAIPSLINQFNEDYSDLRKKASGAILCFARQTKDFSAIKNSILKIPLDTKEKLKCISKLEELEAKA